MTPDAITSWLNAPATLPDNATIDQALQDWPWFVPTHLMNALREHQRAPFSPRTLTTVQLYSDSWLPAYSLLLEEKQPKATAATPRETENNEQKTNAEPTAKPVITQSEQLPLQPEETLIQPLYIEDYFRYEGVEVSHAEPEPPEQHRDSNEQPQTLMVMMSFAEWLNHYKIKSLKEQEEEKEKSALRSMWQQEKLAAALEDEPEEIPEDVFEMAVSSITREDDLVSEPLAQIYERQEKWGAAAEMYRKLALKYPAKSTYFASRAEAAKKRLT